MRDNNREPFVSGVYRPEEDATAVPLTLKQITGLHSRNNTRRKRSSARYQVRMTPGHREAYDRMVGSE